MVQTTPAAACEALFANIK